MAICSAMWSAARGTHVGLEAAQPPPVVGPLLGVAGRDLGRRLARRRGRPLQLVLALVGVGDEVAHVGDVGDVGDLVPGGQQHPAQEVGHQLAAHVAEGLGGVDGGAAGVDADLPRLERHQGRDLPGAGVVEPEVLQPGGHHVRSHPPIMADGPARPTRGSPPTPGPPRTVRPSSVPTTGKGRHSCTKNGPPRCDRPVLGTHDRGRPPPPYQGRSLAASRLDGATWSAAVEGGDLAGGHAGDGAEVAGEVGLVGVAQLGGQVGQ